MEYIVATGRDVNLCPITVLVEASILGVPHSGASAIGVFFASVNRQIPVPRPAVWESKGRHEIIFWVPDIPWPRATYHLLPPTAALADIRDAPLDLDPRFECEIMQGGTWLGGGCELPNCPLIVDTARDGYKLTSVENGVRFDLNADGVPEQVAWTRRDSDDAFLALDRNGNGQIDNGSELFGNFTPVGPDRPEITTANGFEALKFAETQAYGSSYRDGVIDARDAVFSRLVLWRDLNHNGFSEPDELEPVTASGLRAIGTEYKNSRRVDRHGNEFRQRSHVLWKDGKYDHIFDVWLNWRD
jgi:hypothetical protein